MIEQIINQLILTVGAWNESGQQDQFLEWQFERYLFDLQLAVGTDYEGAMQLLLTSLGVKEAAA